MKKTAVASLGLILCGTAFAQLPKWLISPAYDELKVKVENSLLQTDSLGITSLWTKDGKCLFRTEHYVHPFKNGVAVITKKNSNELVGTVEPDGRYTEMPNVTVAYEHPCFEDEYLICNDSIGYSYYGKDAARAKFAQSVRSYPFYAGYAPFFTYEQMEKKKDPYYGYYRADGQAMRYRMMDKDKEKEVNHKDIRFLSRIGANERGVAVIKNKLYFFNPETELFEPFLYGDEESVKKRHLNLNGDYDKYFLDLPNDTVKIVAKYGKNKAALLQFDNELRPISFVFDGNEQIFDEPEPQKFKYVSDLSSFGKDGKYGLSSKSGELLPPQFEEVGLVYDNKAFVRHNGKWGIIEVLPESAYKFRLNKGDDVAFRHQKFETQIRLDFPAEISAKDLRINVPESSGCIIDKTSRVTRDTESGNYVVYDCTLTIPENLPDTMTTITYSPISISYNDLHLFDTSIDIKAWHLKYYNVDIVESETSIKDGIALFTIDINAQKNVGENDYPFDVRIEADSVSVQYEKVSETCYKCLVSNLQEGINDLNILVTEKGCPPSVFPYEVFYTGPVSKKKAEEAILIRKKTPQVSAQTESAELIPEDQSVPEVPNWPY